MFPAVVSCRSVADIYQTSVNVIAEVATKINRTKQLFEETQDNMCVTNLIKTQITKIMVLVQA